MRFALILFFPLTILCCQQSAQLEKLEKQKLQIEKKLIIDSAKLITLVKIYGSQELKVVKGKDWPDEIETTYNVLKNENGQVILFAEFPTSQSGDWILGLQYYYSNNGNLIAFEKRFSYFCGEETILEKEIEFYDGEFNLIKSTKALTNDKDKEVKDSKCIDPNDQEGTKLPTIKELLELKKIRV